jgi:uncharacterized protein YkwD
MSRLLRRLFLVAAILIAGAPAHARSLENAVLEEINFARTQPQEYARELRRYRTAFNGRIVSDERGDRMSFEGVRAVDEAIAFLERQQPLEPLRRGSVLAMAATDHVVEQGRRGSYGHISANGANPGRRVAVRGGGRFVSETIAYGESDPVGVVRSLIVDDGVPNRSHRAVIFMSHLRYAGVGCGAHAQYDVMCVVDYAPTVDGQPPRGPDYAQTDTPRLVRYAF